MDGDPYPQACRFIGASRGHAGAGAADRVWADPILDDDRFNRRACNGDTQCPSRPHGLQSIEFEPTRYELDWGLPMCRWFGDNVSVDAWPDGTTTYGWGPPWDERAPNGRLLALNRVTPGDQVLEFLARNKVAYLNTRAKWAQMLARHAIRSGQFVPLKMVLTFGTGITDDERADIRSAFGCEMKALYSSMEAFSMGQEMSPNGSHAHQSRDRLSRSCRRRRAYRWRQARWVAS